MIYLSLVIIVIFLIIRYLRQWYTYWDRQGLKGPRFLDFKMAFYCHSDYTEFSAKKYGKIYGSYSLLQRILVVNDPEVIKEVLITSFNDCHSHRDFNFGQLCSKSLFCVSDKDDWKRIRSILTPAFSSSKIKTMMGHISEVTDQLITNLEKYEKNDKVFDLSRYVQGFTLDVIAMCAYGIKTDSVTNPDHPLVINVKKLLSMDISLSKIFSLLMPSVARFFKIEFFETSTSEYLAQLTKQVIVEREKMNDKAKKNDFIQLMIDAQNNVENVSENENKSEKTIYTLSEDELIGSGVFFFFAGSDTSAAALLHGFFHLAKNKDIQQKLYEELKDIKDFSYEVLTPLKYLNAVINEILRLSTPAIPVTRTTHKDLVLNGINVPAGTVILTHPYALHTDPDYWSDPLKFKPDRFFEPYNQSAYLPFGDGPRICIGYQFALSELRICFAKLITKFEFSLAPGFHKLDFFAGNILNIPRSVKLNIKVR